MQCRIRVCDGYVDGNGIVRVNHPGHNETPGKFHSAVANSDLFDIIAVHVPHIGYLLLKCRLEAGYMRWLNVSEWDELIAKYLENQPIRSQEYAEV